MARYSVIKSIPDEETPSVADELSVPENPNAGDEVWIESLETLVIWTGTTWQAIDAGAP